MSTSGRQDRPAGKQEAELPRYVADYLGQTMRNRYQDTVLSPIPDDMQRLLEALGRSGFPGAEADPTQEACA